MKSTILLILTLFTLTTQKENWALLAAGSFGFDNYRHQSDVFHAYQILTRNGIPQDHIITMAFDDIAMDPINPLRGKVFNHPNGTDVYAGVKINYKADDVSADNFLAILKGEKSKVQGGDGKVLESTSEDNVFVFYSDHGDYEVLGFPTGFLFGEDLDRAMKYLTKHKKYNKLVFYIEACNSGSMFKDYLKAGANIYAVTAADPEESSYAVYCDNEAEINGTFLDTCLGDEFSCNWMEQTDSIDIWETTVGQQVTYVTKATKESHVQKYGELNIEDDLLGEYQGHKSSSKWFKFLGDIDKEVKIEDNKRIKINSRDTRLHFLKRRAEKSDNIEDLQKYLDEVRLRRRSKKIFDSFASRFNLGKRTDGKINFDCYKRTVNAYKNVCGFDADRDMGFLGYFASFCSRELDVFDAVDSLKDICSKV